MPAERFLQKDGMVINADYLPILEHLGLTSFDDVMSCKDGTLVAVGKRGSVVRLEAQGQTFYLKRHRARPLKNFFRGLLRFQRVDKNGFSEWKNILKVRGLGLNTATPVAAGQRKNGAVVETFVMTVGLDGMQPLDAFLRTLSPQQLALKREVIQEVGRLVGTLHQNGLFHQDLHLRHFYIELLEPELSLSEGGASFKLYLIDLQPLKQSRWLKFKIKDLARLYLDSLTVVKLTSQDRLRFYKAYAGREKIYRLDLLLFWLVRLKAHWMERHEKRIERRRRQQAEAKSLGGEADG